MPYKVLIAGETDNHCLEMAYQKAFAELGHEVLLFDTRKALMKYARPGKWGFLLHRFFPVEAWLRKANKDLANTAKAFKPDLFIAFTGAEILPGTFAYIRSILPTKICWYWADPLPNLNRYIHGSLLLTDIVFSYSRSSLRVFEEMGARKAVWLPFAGDLSAHFEKTTVRTDYAYDLSFVGSWRPEREKALRQIHQQFPALKIRINGPYWNRCSYQPLKKISSSKPLYGKAFTDIVGQSFLNLNVMDDTNYPSANMRFFEITAAGGAQLCSAAPEMEDNFVDRRDLLYFKDEQQLEEQIKYALANKGNIEQMKLNAQQRLLSEDLYRNRAEAILKALK